MYRPSNFPRKVLDSHRGRFVPLSHDVSVFYSRRWLFLLKPLYDSSRNLGGRLWDYSPIRSLWNGLKTGCFRTRLFTRNKIRQFKHYQQCVIIFWLYHTTKITLLYRKDQKVKYGDDAITIQSIVGDIQSYFKEKYLLKIFALMNSSLHRYF